MSPIATTRRNKGPALTKANAHRAAILALSIFVLLWFATSRYYSTIFSSDECLISHGAYAGSVYGKPSETLRNKCLVESPWMRLAQHTVRMPPPSAKGDDGNGKVIDDWLWIDYHDRINVLVEAPRPAANASAAAAVEEDGTSQEQDEPSFMILSQTKYALEDTSLAIVGGIIEPREDALAAAQREVHEELQVTCRNWKVLGSKFRTDVNRGMGWVHPYLSMDCSYSPDNVNANAENVVQNVKSDVESEEVGGRDTEKQNVQIMRFSEVKRSVMGGKFAEVQWSNTVALAMLHLASLEETS